MPLSLPNFVSFVSILGLNIVAFSSLLVSAWFSLVPEILPIFIESKSSGKGASSFMLVTLFVEP